MVALDCEARPLRESLRLRRRENLRGWPVYCNAAQDEWLVVSGVGRVASSAAVGFLGGVAGQACNTTWWNVGIAGHKSLAVSELRRAGKVVDACSGRAFYPMAVAKGGALSETVTTVDVASGEYPSEGMVDMEAAGFCAAAARLASRERIHVMKVISDNAKNPFPNQPDPRMAESLVAGALSEILKFANATQELVEAVFETEFEQACDRWVAVVSGKVKFSQTQQRQLRRLIERMQALGGVEEPVLLAILEEGSRAAAVLRRLEEELSGRALHFSH